MVLTPSTMIPLGTPCPEFSLPDLDGSLVSPSDYDGVPLLVAFICNHCPYVKHIADVLSERCTQWVDAGVAVLLINSNDVENYPEDHPDKMRQEAALRAYTVPYLFDETQDVAKAFSAACTPDFFLFDAEHKLVYRGEMDGARPGNDVPVTGERMDAAVQAVLSDGVPPEQVPSMGCNIKWKP